jgi:hypothetical protein
MDNVQAYSLSDFGAESISLWRESPKGEGGDHSTASLVFSYLEKL